MLVTALLLANAGLMALLIVSSLSDRSAFVTEPRYYQRALEWDRVSAQRMASAKLGWSARIDVAPPEGDGAEPLVSCRLADAQGSPIDDAVVVLEAFHLARAQHRVNASLEPVGPGLYGATLPVGRPGHWEFRISVKRGETVFIETCRVVVDPSDAVGGG